jgi:hypothetical protein
MIYIREIGKECLYIQRNIFAESELIKVAGVRVSYHETS